MNNELQFKIVRGKGSYGYNNTTKQISDILSINKDASQCTELRILQCEQLYSLDGIQVCKILKNLNLSSNAIIQLTPLKHLVNLEVLNLKSNKIKSLRGIEGLRKLIKLDACQNKIETLQGLCETNSQLQTIILFKNNIKYYQELDRLKSFKSIKEISFEKSVDKSNPFCQNKPEYYRALQTALFASKDCLQKIDEMPSQQIRQFFKKTFNQSLSNEQQSHEVSNDRILQKHPQLNYTNQFQNKRTYNQSVNNMASQQVMMMSQRQADLEHIIEMKAQTIQELKHKYAQLQMTSTNQYRDSIKKEVEFERVTGQLSQLSRAIDQKDSKINQLHRRIEELLKINTAANNQADNRSQELQKLRRDYNELRIQNSQLRVLNKDQENRLRQLQNRTLTNIEDKTQRIEQFRSKSEGLMKQNYELQRQQQQYKDRVRELTQLLKEWQAKYEQTVQELETYHNSQKEQIFRQMEGKSSQMNRKFEEAQRQLNHEWQQKINGLQSQYSHALEAALEKYHKLKKAFDEKYQSQSELKTLLKSVMSKNTQNQSTIREYEDAVIKSKKTIISLTAEHDSLVREHYQLKNRLQNEVRQLQNELSKSNFIRDKLERDMRELRVNNEYLQKNFDNLNSRQKEFEELLQRNENLQTALDAKNVMLDDKNETIQSLKVELESIQKDQEGKVDIKQHQKLNQKYRRQKDLLKSLEEQNNALAEENKELAQRCEVNNTLEQEFSQVKDIMRKQEGQIREKEEVNTQLVYSLEKLKTYSENITEELNALKNQRNKLIHTLQEKQSKWERALKEKQAQNQRRLKIAQDQTNRYKQITQQFRVFTKSLNF